MIMLGKNKERFFLKICSFFVAVFFIIISLPVKSAGVSLEATRVIYDENNKTANVIASNSSMSTHLIQSWVENISGEQVDDFFTVPPLFKLDSSKKNAIQIIKRIDLPYDRETLYWLNVNFVPPSNKDDVNVIRFSVNNKIKLIYRPDDLRNVDFSEEVEKLDFSIGDKFISVKNESPYYINVGEWRLGDNILHNPSYFEPYSTTTIDYDGRVGNGIISVFYINDLGGLEKKEFKVME